MAAAKRKKTTHGKHRTTSVKGARKGRRKKAKVASYTADPAKPANAVYKTLDKDPTYGSEFVYSWSVGGCFNKQCTQRHATITTPGWTEKYIVTFKIPEVPKLGTLRLHKRIAPQFEAFFKAGAAKGHASKIVNNAGTFVPRTITGNQSKLSNHALGTAIDVSSEQNGYNQPQAARGTHGSLCEHADFCVDFGLYWGGWYERKKDAMHFEAVKVLTAAELQAACTKHGVNYASLSQSPTGSPGGPAAPAAPAAPPIPPQRPPGL